MGQKLGKHILKGVSRSFYLSLRLLPAPMREAASLAYLLARSSDTMADAAGAPVPEQLGWLGEFGHAVAGAAPLPPPSQTMLRAIADPRELLLIGRLPEMLAWLQSLPPDQAELVREVIATILSGQRLDLERFSAAGPDRPVSLADEAELEDYTWRVAGCVGAFWTKLGFLTLGSSFSRLPPPELLELGITYGKGLQLVNILRDLPVDLAAGRCYLPIRDPLDRAACLHSLAEWLPRARAWVSAGDRYARALRLYRLRAASRLPGLLARDTLDRLQGKRWEQLQARIKVPRTRVYARLLEALLS